MLVVDDNRDGADALGLLVEELGNQVHVTYGGTKALEVATAFRPDLMLIDEPTEGLAPKLVEQVGELLAEIARRGVSVLLVEQKLAIALKISSRLYVMGHGRIVFEGIPADFGEKSAVRKEWLEV